ncbi:MAG: hypothetical protein JNN07_24400 [Verrucomicrobiales bacterium]|nr:hypothetical protein [Verrucomicrobiales bacterium]
MNPPSMQKPVTCLRKRLAQVIAYYFLLLIIMLGLLTGYLRSFMPFVLVPLLWFATRPSFPLKPQLPEQEFSPIEWRLWFGGAAVSGLIVVVCAYGSQVRDALALLQALAIGVVTWAFVFLAYRDCRRTAKCVRIA